MIAYWYAPIRCIQEGQALQNVYLAVFGQWAYFPKYREKRQEQIIKWLEECAALDVFEFAFTVV